MGVLAWTARRLSVHTGANRENTDAFDLRDSCEVHAVLEVTMIGGTNPQLQVRGEHSIDGLAWEDLDGLAFETTIPVGLERSATTSAFRYLRFAYLLSGTNAHATFAVRMFAKTYGEVVPVRLDRDADWQALGTDWRGLGDARTARRRPRRLIARVGGATVTPVVAVRLREVPR